MAKVGVSIPSMETFWRRGGEAGSCSSSSVPPALVPQVTGGGEGTAIVHGMFAQPPPGVMKTEEEGIKFVFLSPVGGSTPF